VQAGRGVALERLGLLEIPFWGQWGVGAHRGWRSTTTRLSQRRTMVRGRGSACRHHWRGRRAVRYNGGAQVGISGAGEWMEKAGEGEVLLAALEWTVWLLQAPCG
jgi:hypothetical protein